VHKKIWNQYFGIHHDEHGIDTVTVTGTVSLVKGGEGNWQGLV